MRTRVKELVLVVSLLATPMAYAETKTTVSPAAPEAKMTESPVPAVPAQDATTQQVAMQSEAPRDNALRNIKVYPCF